MRSNKNALVSSKSPFVSVAANLKVAPNSKLASNSQFVSNSKLGDDSRIANISIESKSSAPISPYAKESPKSVNAVEPKPNLQKLLPNAKHDSAEEHHKTSKSLVKVKRKKTKSNKSEALHLYEDEPHGTMAQFLRGFTVPGPQDKNNEKSSKLGCMLGVYLPTAQNIMGVTMFLRLLWIIGVGGIGHTFLMVFICCLCTFLTSISVSAVATNGVLEGSGTYFMISRNLGAQFGASIGILFYLANAVATSMYCVGGVELLLIYMEPRIPQFGDPKSHDESAHENMLHNFRLYGTVFLVVVIIIVAAGVRIVQITAPISLFCVIVSVISVYIGIFVAKLDTNTMLCMVGDKLLLPKAYFDDIDNCTASVVKEYYNSINASAESLKYLEEHPPRAIDGIPGMSAQTFRDNFFEKYLEEGESAPNERAEKRAEVHQDVGSNFFIIMGIFFPSVTGIFTGCNISGDLKDPQKSLPIGTIAAQLTTSVIYLSYVFLFGSAIERALLCDKYGDSFNREMITAQLSWPSKWFLLIGAFLSTFGAALQSLCSAPRLLQSIAKDDVIYFLRIFSKVNRWNEPWNALWLSSIIAEIGILIGSIEGIAPVVDFFFLMCYFSVNAICVLQTVLKPPNWRPRFKYYHWSLSLLGALLCFFIMVSTYWYYTIVVVVLAFIIYKYVDYKGARKEWGDGIRGLALSTAQFSLLRLEDKKSIHPKNWRPQLLVLVKVSSGADENVSRKLVQLAGYLKGGQGLTIVATLLDGDISSAVVRENGETVEQKLKCLMKESKVQGFTQVIIGKHSAESVSSVIQAIGIGGLRPNTVMVGWPSSWRKKHVTGGYIGFMDAIHRAATADMCLLVPKGILNFPAPSDRLKGTIDVWWIMQAGGLVMLLPFLMKMDPLWRGCKLRVFAVVEQKDNKEKMKKVLQDWVYQLRIDAIVEVIELADNTISAYTNDTRARMNELDNLLHLTEREKKKELQLVRNECRMKQKVDEGKLVATDAGGDDSKGSSYKKLSQFDDVQYEDNDSSERKLTSAVRLNQVLRTQSTGCELLVVNLPRPPESKEGFIKFLEYTEALTEGLKRVLLVRGSGKEVITIYN